MYAEPVGVDGVINFALTMDIGKSRVPDVRQSQVVEEVNRVMSAGQSGSSR